MSYNRKIGKQWYKYRSERRDGSVKSIYLGKADGTPRPERMPEKSYTTKDKPKIDKGKLLFVNDEGTRVYELEYTYNILKSNPIRQNELKYAMGKEKMPQDTIPQHIHKNAWDLYFKKHDKIMVYSTYPVDTYWYVDKNGNKIKE